MIGSPSELSVLDTGLVFACMPNPITLAAEVVHPPLDKTKVKRGKILRFKGLRD